MTERHSTRDRKWRAAWRDHERVFANIRENAFLPMLVGYVIVLSVCYAYYGVLFQFSLGLFFLILLPFTLVVGRTTEFVKQLTPFLMLLLSYEALQGIAGSHTSFPIIQIGPHAGSSPSFNLVTLVQSSLYSPPVTDAASVLYGLHFPLVAVLAVLLWYSDRTLYKRYLIALVACSYVSLVF